MYKQKPHVDCHPLENSGPLNVLALNASLKRSPNVSNTGELAELVIKHILARAPGSHAEVVRLADCMLPSGLGFRESDDDDWPGFVAKIKTATSSFFARRSGGEGGLA